ncbi:MAG: TetR family transcriptional regulator [Pseudonocardiales bacterium]|nr:TetR family transcriptional regulator [Pseudonocardiales bacterium]
MNTPSGAGLRERKKQATRQALSWAALRLAVERGLDNVLVEDIAAAAEVSPRTFNNYFSSKAEAIASRHLDRVEGLAATLREQPAAAPLWDAITDATVARFDGGAPDPTWAQGVRLVTSEPSLVAEFLKADARGEEAVAMAVAARVGVDSADDPYPHLVAGAVGVCLRVAMAQWTRADPPAPLGALLRSAIAQVAAGLPDPADH